MDKEFSFRKLICYQKGRLLVKEIYKIVRTLPSEEKYALGDQLRRAVVSVTSNIAEGTGRQSFKDQAHYIELSYGSLMEVMSQLDVALDMGFIDNAKHNELEAQISEEARILSGYRASLLSKL
ncbi:MAG: four helix bundle protein [Bacteroidaceae bacterium]|nr:four helix bundle protein [Bacteroidaceae bacterium]